ncbi:MAG: nitric oxide reductase activation protein NorD [Candidatus Brocadiia bacterium]
MERMKFDLRDVTWGYQELFREIIVELFEADLLGEANQEVTEDFFEILSHSDKSGFDMVLKSYLAALKGQYRWIMRLPRLFERWSRTGLQLARERYFLGARFFEFSGEGRLGTKPKDVEFALDLIVYLEQEEPELIGPLLEGYEELARELDHDAMRQYIANALTLQRRNPESARRFLAGELDTSRIYIEKLSSQAALSDCKSGMERLGQAVSGHKMEVDDLGRLDSDDLQERGSVLVACGHAMYLPQKISEFPERELNEQVYKTMVSTACASQLADSFSTRHGQDGLETCCNLFDSMQMPTTPVCSLFYVAELYRTMRFCHQHFPGMEHGLQQLVDLEFQGSPPISASDTLMALLLGRELEAPVELRELAGLVKEVASESDNFETTRDLLAESYHRQHRDIPRLNLPRAVCFFPDPIFPMTITTAGADQLTADLHQASESEPPDEEEAREEEAEKEETAPEAEEGGSDEGEEEKPEGKGARPVGYYYDEWNVQVGDYMRDWCCVQEVEPPQRSRETELSDSIQRYADQVRKVFERLKPEEISKEKRLIDGDAIEIDDLIEFIAEGQERKNAETRFYTKPLVKQRDLAVVILLDVSGSTAEETGEKGGEESESRSGAEVPELSDDRGAQTVLEVEKEAAFVLGTGLRKLGDNFAVYGFTGNGRENCLFYNFKDFEEDWDQETLRELLCSLPGSATRIGAALRHAGWKLSHREAKTRLLLLITDGKPCDQGYDTESHYAQHDIRKACQENRRESIHTFCVSTSENRPADMELMFPQGRYLILEDIRKLPAVLSRLYLKITS